jgi:transcriptional regulator with XRE-family HTH domain
VIGNQLRYARQERGLSLRQLARRARLSHSFLSDIEHGRCNPSLDKLCMIAAALNVPPEFFLSQVVVDSDQGGATSIDDRGHR